MGAARRWRGFARTEQDDAAGRRVPGVVQIRKITLHRTHDIGCLHGMDGSDRSGPIALVGSGEYLPQMEEVDRRLLERVGGASARVVVLPTAAGLEEPASPRRWADAGIRHFARLGAQAQAVDILVRDDAFDERWLPLLQAADFIYFSGGSPSHLIETLVDSPAWDAIRARHAAGAVLAGCSAGAMAFGRYTLQPRRLWSK